ARRRAAGAFPSAGAGPSLRRPGGPRAGARADAAGERRGAHLRGDQPRGRGARDARTARRAFRGRARLGVLLVSGALLSDAPRRPDLPIEVGGPEMAPHTPQRSARPGESQGAPRSPASRPEMAPPTSQRSERPGERVALLDPALLDLARLHQQAAVDRELGAGDRSEERRVGKECRAGWVREYGRKKK